MFVIVFPYFKMVVKITHIYIYTYIHTYIYVYIYIYIYINKAVVKSLIKTEFKLAKVINTRGVSRTLIQNVVSDIGRMQILFSLPLFKLLKLYYHGGVFLVC